MPPRAATLPLLLVQGSWSEAEDLALVTRVKGSPLERPMAITVLGYLAYCRGDASQAWEMVRELLPRGAESEPDDGLFPYSIEMLRLATRLSLQASDTSGAASWLKTHDFWLAWSGSVRGRAEASLLRSQLCRLLGDLDAAAADGAEALRLASAPHQPLVQLEAHRVLGEIALEDGRIHDAERALTASLELTQACAIPNERASTLLSIARLYCATGRDDRVQPLLEEVQGIASDLKAASLSRAAAEIQASLHPAPRISNLTDREVEVLRLVAEGLTDAEAAERLFISRRTVSQHLRSVYNKLGVSSRAAATRVAVEDRLV